jgi:tetratricopeptide (TPR) repeat protein
MRVFLRLSFFGLLFPALLLAARAQTPLKPAADADKFAAEPSIFQHASMVYVEKGGYREQTIVVKVQSDAALRQLGVVTIAYASASEHVEFHYVRVRRSDGTVLETNVADALDEPAPVTREAPSYSDLKQKELPVKSLRVGDTLEWQVRVVRTVAEVPGQFWGAETFGSEGIVLDQTVELRFPATLKVNVWTNPKDGPPPADTVEQADRVYRWKHSNLKPTVGPEADAAKKAAETRLLPPDEVKDVEDGKLASIQWTTFPNWAAVGTWYRQLEAPRVVADDTVKAKVAEITAGKTSTEDKAHAIYNYVSLQIRYIGVSFGIGRYQPHSAADVLGNQYGDCKDKHTLLASMLSVIGLQSDAVLIGAGIRLNEAVPSPEAFNHLITRAQLDGKEVWLDSTTEVGPWSYLLPIIRDKPSLVIPAETAATIVKTPKAIPFAAYSSSDVTGSLDKDFTSDSEIVLTYRDDDEIILRSAIRQITAGQYGDAIQRFAAGMGYGGTTSQPQITGLSDPSQPLKIAFHYHRVKDPSWGDNRITANFSMIGLPTVDDQHPPVAPIQLGIPRTETSTLAMRLPEHWGAQLPEATHAKASYGTCDVTYRLEKGEIFGLRRVEVLAEKVPATEWKAYKQWADDCGVGSWPYLQLVPNVASTTPKASSNAVSNALAAKLIQEADTAERNHDPAMALKLLDQAKALNPQQPNLWGIYGFRAVDLGAPNEAIEDYRKELLFHPDQTWVYAPLAQELFRAGKPDDAIATCHDGLAADPASDRINATCIRLMLRQGLNTDAASAGTAALKLLPTSDKYRDQIVNDTAKAQIANKNFGDAAAMLVSYLKEVHEAGPQNDAAYELALTGLELPIAEANARASVEARIAASRTLTLDESDQTLKPQATLMGAAWDTLAYILFREGHIKEARQLVEAAWRNRQDLEIGQHLGDMALADNDPEAALRSYELALASTSPNAGPTAAVAITAINEGITRAEKAGAKSKLNNARAELQKTRIIELGSAGKLSGSAEYRLLISQDKVEIVKPVGEQAIPGGEDLLRRLSFVGYTPPESNAKLVKTGFLNCHGTSCQFVIEP